MLWRARKLLGGTVDLYYANLDDPEFDIPAITHVLSPEEQVKSERFRFDHHRRRFRVGRSALRWVLADVVGGTPEDVILLTEPAGKPRVHGGPAFNLSHSEQHLLIAMACDGCVGVDVEVKRPVPDVLNLARACFAPHECAGLDALATEERSMAFLGLWTRKESLLKAVGAGLTVSLDQVTMEIGDRGGNLLRTSQIDGVNRTHWCVQSVDIHENLRAAVSWNRPAFSLRSAFASRPTSRPAPLLP